MLSNSFVLLSPSIFDVDQGYTYGQILDADGKQFTIELISSGFQADSEPVTIEVPVTRKSKMTVVSEQEAYGGYGTYLSAMVAFRSVVDGELVWDYGTVVDYDVANGIHGVKYNDVRKEVKENDFFVISEAKYAIAPYRGQLCSAVPEERVATAFEKIDMNLNNGETGTNSIEYLREPLSQVQGDDDLVVYDVHTLKPFIISVQHCIDWDFFGRCGYWVR